MRFTRHPLTLATKLIITGALVGASINTLAQETSAIDDESVPTIWVTTLSVDEDSSKVIAPFSIMDAKAAFSRGNGTMGDLLNGLPGVNADTFGGGASRPVVRGQTSPRVKVLSDGAGLLDASEISPDHAVTADPLLATKVEVLRGPATLLYGGGAIGGVVNVLDNKILTEAPEKAIEGFVALRGNSVSNEEAGALSVTAKAGDNIAVHIEGSSRDADNYETPDWDESHVDGTFAESKNGSVGASWVGEKGYLGVAYSYRDDDYGLPGHNHEFEGCHPHGDVLHCGTHEEEGDDHHHEHEGEHEAPPVIALESKRIDLRGEYDEPFAGVHKIRIRASHTDYQHQEIEEGAVATTFLNKGYEGRLELDHAPVLGWHGIVGAQFSNTEFSALGEEAFMPTTDSKMVGVFAVEHYQLSDQWHLEAGARYEQQRHTPIDDPRSRPEYDDSATSFSAAVIWEFTDEQSLALSFSNAERLPQAQELYARGIHIATNTYECGMLPHSFTCGGATNDGDIGKEVSNNVELTLRKHTGDLTYSVNVFRNNVDDYIYARTLDQFEAFRLIKYTQQDAKFTGGETEVSFAFSDLISATLFGDYVRAEFIDGGNLPRIPSARIGARVNLHHENMDAELEFYRVDKQDDIASYETVTAGYNMLNITVNFNVFNDERYAVFVRGNNLLNEQAWNHASFLADTIPLPGRGLSAGFKYSF